MSISRIRRLGTRLGHDLHYGLIANGGSALAGALVVIIVRASSDHSFLIAVNCEMLLQVAIGAALISYFMAALERKVQWACEFVTAASVAIIGLMVLRFSTAEWKSVQTLFAITAVMKPISARLASYLSPTLASAG